MLWNEFKRRLVNLGFEEYSVFDENPEHIIQAYNRANVMLHKTVEPKDGNYLYTVPADTVGYADFDLSAISDFAEKSASAPKTISGDVISDTFYILDTLYISPEYAGQTINIPYHSKVNPITTSSTDNTVIDCKEDLIPYLELLTAYFIWLDDDERKAVMYYNMFQEMYQMRINSMASGTLGAYNENTSVKATIKGGVDIENIG